MNNSTNILLLEDNLNDAELAHHQVLKSGINFKWLHVSDWDGFIEAINHFKPDVILSDYNLGSFTGLDALTFAQANCPLVPFIIVTGTLNEETAADTIKMGAWDYVVKERLMRLSSAIKNVLRLKVEKENSAIAREKLKTNEERYRLVFNNTPDGLFISNMNGVTIEANHAVSEILGLRNEDIIGKNFLNLGLLPKNQIPKAIKIMAKEVFSKTQDHDELIITRKDGSEVNMELNVHFFDYLGEKHMLGIVRDITQRKEKEKELLVAKEQAENSDKLKSAFLANMSHEIRTPMNGILGFTELLQGANLSVENQNDYIGIIKKSGERLLNTVNDIIEISKIESAEIKVTNSEVDIIAYLDTLVSFFKPEAKKKNLEIIVQNNIDQNSLLIVTDKTKLNSILTNLIKNAIKYTNAGTIKVGVKIENGQLLFSCQDSGIGIPKNRLKAIFNRFEQADIDDKLALQGSGLGLAIVKSYIKMLGGKVWLESEEGWGSIFYVSLPYDSNIQKEPIVLQKEKSADSDKKNIKVLVVEDEEFSSIHLLAVLKGVTKNIRTAQNGIEAVDICKNDSSIDLVLMDIKMPKMDGIEATKTIREFNKDVVIIAQTAYAFDEDKQNALTAGCTDYISKPIKKDKLLELINRYS